MLLKRPSERSCILINLKWKRSYSYSKPVWETLRELNYSCTCGLLSFRQLGRCTRIIIYIERKKEVYFARILIKHSITRCVFVFFIAFATFIKYLFARSRLSYWFPLSDNKKTDNAIRDWMIRFPLFKLQWKEYFYNFIILDLSIKLLYTSSINIRQFSMESMSMTKVYCRTRSLILARKIQENEKLIQL